ncbi:MAG TPA: hypothetical protein VNQ77_13350 [Frankiaceae bacterium]|nr:hypothetical protein [Frankiaceae bacterium]
MNVLGVALFSIAVLDALLGTRRQARRMAAAAVAAAGCAMAGGLAVGMSWRATSVLVASVVVEALLWIAARNAVGRRAAYVLAGLLAALALRMATSAVWVTTGESAFDRWAASLPGTLGADAERVAFVGGAVAFLLTAANTLVRLLLAAAPSSEQPRNPPGGGRVIGSLERVLVFGLAVAGEPTAATLVVSAKGVLRFAEVRAASGDVDQITEYVLVGSLASIALALAFVPFAVA